MNRERLIEQVRHVLDEQQLLTSAEMVMEDSLPIEGRIDALYPATMQQVQELLPVEKLVSREYKGELMPDYGTGTGRMKLPADFQRLAYFKMKGWRRGVSDPILESGKDYIFQQTPSTRGGCHNPVIAIIEAGRMIEYFSLPLYWGVHELEEMRYIPLPTDISTDEPMPAAHHVLVWMLARNVAASFGRDISKIENIIKEMIS